MDENVKEIHRGGVWYVVPEGVHLERGVIGSAGRPAIVISSDFGNDRSPVVNVIYTGTGAGKAKWTINVPVYIGGRLSYALCSQIDTISRDRLGFDMGHVSEDELQKIDEQLKRVLALTEPKSEPGVPDQKDNATLRMELDFYRRGYNKLLNEVVEARIREEIAARASEVQETPEEKPSEVEKIHTEEPVFSGKLNVNDVKARDLMVKLGMCKTLAYGITGTRKKLGNYEKLEDLLVVKGFTEKQLERYRERLTVCESGIS